MRVSPGSASAAPRSIGAGASAGCSPGSGAALWARNATSEFAAGLYTPETLIKAVHDEGIGPGVEFNIAQLLRTYPDVDAEFVKLWFDSLEKYGLEASAVGTNLDMGARPLRRAVEHLLEDALSEELLKGHFEGAKRVLADAVGENPDHLTFTGVAEAAPPPPPPAPVGSASS